MDEQSIPIDINTNKLLDWLVSRRHVNKDWQNNVIQIREKINNAIQDMPAHEGIIKLVSGQHINYFHCIKIIEILKETEKDTKNLFGRYGSQRMKDWQDIISCYQKDNLYLAEAAQMLIRNVSYEIPSLKKQQLKLGQMHLESEKKIKDYTKIEATASKEFKAACDQLGIAGDKIKIELLSLVKELPKIYKQTSEKLKIVKPALELYSEFNKFLSGKEGTTNILPHLEYLIQNGDTTTYEYMYGEQPVKIEYPVEENFEEKNENEENIDFGEDIDFGENGVELDIDFGEVQEGDIDWGNGGNSEEGFEIVNHDDLEINLEESGIVVEKSGIDGGIARGEEALTILDNPKTREQIINNLIELHAFLKIRLFEMSSESDLLSMSQMQDAPAILQMQTIESIATLTDNVNVALNELTNKRIQHLHNIKHSPKYVDILTASIKQKLSVVGRMQANKTLLENKIVEIKDEGKTFDPILKMLIEKTRELQKEIQEDISKKYKGRIVNIVGGVNIL